MKKTVVFLLFLIISIKTVQAHNPLSAMYYLEVKKNINILNISLSQTGLNEALKKHYKNTDFAILPDIEYKQLTIKYLKENFNLKINNIPVLLEEGGIKLGNHQTDIKFIIKELPKKIEHLEVKIEAFKENQDHQTIFSLLLNGNTSKVILNSKNNYTASVVLKNSLMQVSTDAFNKTYLWCLAIIPVFILGKKLIKKAKQNYITDTNEN